MTVLLLGALAATAAGEVFCVRPDGSTYGQGDGSDWANAFSGFPSSTSGLWGDGPDKIGTGDTVLVAGGDYTTSLRPGASGTGEAARLVIRRATVDDHGPSAGWSSGMDGQVKFTGSAYIDIVGRSYITVDGVTDDGFYSVSNSTYGLSIRTSRHILIEYVRADGSVQQDNYRGFDLRDSSDVTLRYCWSSYNPNDSVYMSGMDGAILEHCKFGPRIKPIDYGWHADLIEARNNTNIDFRFNDVNWAPDGVFLFEGNTYWRIYGNIFRGGGKGTRTHSTNPVNGPVYVHNNVFYQSYQGIAYGSNISGAAHNNVFYANSHAPSFGGLTASHNYYYATGSVPDTGPDPFVDAAGLDFHLIPGTPAVDGGAALPPPFDVDADGVQRPQGDGWDTGAYEHTPPLPPVADAGPDRTIVDEGGAGFVVLTLDGSGSYAPEGTIVQYIWRMGQTALGFQAVQIAVLEVGVHTITLEVTDSNGAKAVDTVVITVESASPPIPGDANRDGRVDLDDFVILKRNFGVTEGATWEMGDFNGDGAVDLNDFTILKQHFAR